MLLLLIGGALNEAELMRRQGFVSSIVKRRARRRRRRNKNKNKMYLHFIGPTRNSNRRPCTKFKNASKCLKVQMMPFGEKKQKQKVNLECRLDAFPAEPGGCRLWLQVVRDDQPSLRDTAMPLFLFSSPGLYSLALTAGTDKMCWRFTRVGAK